MAEKITLNIQKRKEIGKKVKILRRKGLIPGIIYGRDIKPIPVAIDYSNFDKAYNQAGESTILELNIDGKEKKNVLIKDIQLDPLTDRYQHVDFYQIKMTEEITAEVELKFKGEALAVKEKGGVLVKNIDELEVKCLPADLPSEIEVDISPLKTFDDVIKVKDLNIPDKVEVLANPEDVVATVAPPRSEEEIKELEEKVEEKVEEVEGVAKEEPVEEATETEAAAKPEKKEEKKVSKEERASEEKSQKGK